jgi:rhodanese-related sulfurtransferase
VLGLRAIIDYRKEVIKMFTQRKNLKKIWCSAIGGLMILLISASYANSQSSVNIHQATLMELGEKTPEISTEELRKILAERSATVFDARPFKEFAVSHIPGAVNLSAKPGVEKAVYVSDVAEVGSVLKGNKAAPIVLYCNGMHCGKSNRLAADLLNEGYTNVRRYQLGIPVWRALGGVTQIEPWGIKYVYENDQTATFLDVRDPEEFKVGSIPNVRNLPRSGVQLRGKDVGEIRAAKNDGRLPYEDHNTRIIVFGKDAKQALEVADALAWEAFHNVSYFAGTFEEFRGAVGR